MPNRVGVNLSFDEVHCRAICDEIGDRLRCHLAREISEMPSYLLRLINRLPELDRHVSPSLVPSIDTEDFCDDRAPGKRALVDA